MEAFAEFWQSLDRAALLGVLLRLVAVLLCLTVHETAHGLSAYALGDPTAKSQHRLSLNPLHHIDWFGLAAMLIVGFGWAKPVPVDMRYFKNPKWGMAITALAGPVSNLIFALISLLFCKLILLYSPDTAFWGWTFSFCRTLAEVNVGLGVFNLIPLSPLDGSKVLLALLPDEAYLKVMRYERFGMPLLYLLVFAGALDGFLGRAVTAVFSGMVDLVF